MKDIQGLKKIEYVYVDDLKFSDLEASIVARELKKHIEAFYNDPNNIKAFEDWVKVGRQNGGFES